MHEKQLTVNELKKMELDTLEFFHEFCEVNNLKYWLTAGSLLGAVRHKGFIPWDDDIDVAMPREDYMKLIRIFPKEGRNGKKLLTPYTDAKSPITFGKLYDENTVKKDREVKEEYWNYGVDIDIFPWDFAPEKLQELNAFYRKQYFLFKIFLGIVGQPRKEKNKTKECLKRVYMSTCKVLSNMKLLDARKIALKMNENASKCPKSGCLCSSMQPLGLNVRGYAHTSCFDELILADFEDHRFFIPKGYDEVLSNLYGNYMEFPPESARVTHHLSDVYMLCEE